MMHTQQRFAGCWIDDADLEYVFGRTDRLVDRLLRVREEYVRRGADTSVNLGFYQAYVKPGVDYVRDYIERHALPLSLLNAVTAEEDWEAEIANCVSSWLGVRREKSQGLLPGMTAAFGRLRFEAQVCLNTVQKEFPGFGEILGGGSGCWKVTSEWLHAFFLRCGCCLTRWQARLWEIARAVDRGFTPADHSYRGGVHWGDWFVELCCRGPKSNRWSRWFRGYLLVGSASYPRSALLALGKAEERGLHRLKWAIVGHLKDSRLTSGVHHSRIQWEDVQARLRMAEKVKPEQGLANAMRKASVWSPFGRVPAARAVRSISPELIPHLDGKVWGCAMELLKAYGKATQNHLWFMSDGNGETQHLVEAVFRTAVAFSGDRNRCKVWLTSDVSVWHDRGVDLPTAPMCDDAHGWLWRYRDDDRVYDAIRVAKAWGALLPLGMSVKTGLSAALKLTSGLAYEEAQSPAFASECARWQIDPDTYRILERRWLSGVNGRTSEGIPFVSVDHGEYRFYRLAGDDPRGLFLGMHTNCCQHPMGVGGTCAWHGASDEFGGFYVVEYRGSIVAQSWAWRSTHDGRQTLCFDNIEMLSDAYSDKVKEVYLTAAKQLLGRLGVRRVVCGLSYGGCIVADLPRDDARIEFPGGYTDAHERAVLAADEA